MTTYLYLALTLTGIVFRQFPDLPKLCEMDHGTKGAKLLLKVSYESPSVTCKDNNIIHGGFYPDTAYNMGLKDIVFKRITCERYVPAATWREGKAKPKVKEKPSKSE